MDVARIRSVPAKPLLVFDGECNFCRYWIERWRRITGERVDYIPFQDPSVAGRFPELPRDRFEQSVQLVETDGIVYSGAEAVFRSLAYGVRWPLWIYRNIFGASTIAEAAYRVVALHRMAFSQLTRLFWGRDPTPPTYVAVRWLFLRLMALSYIIAFVSLWTQIIGLVGHNGIVPAEQVMRVLSENGANVTWQRILSEPTLCWIRADDSFLKWQCAAGTVLGALVLFGIAQKLSLFLLWVIYLSLTTICRIFLGFQWDNLLLETGLLAIIFAPRGFSPRSELSARVSPLGLWLLRWLLFRLMFASGCVKLLSHDPTWRDLTALNFHYETQPLPTWIGWHAHQMPVWWHKTECVLMYVIELGVPFLIFMPRRLRLAAFFPLMILQIVIAATGNYGFFNLLSIALCLVVLDDAAILRTIPMRVRGWMGHWFIRLAPNHSRIQPVNRPAGLPLPKGEGRGEGKGSVLKYRGLKSKIWFMGRENRHPFFVQSLRGILGSGGRIVTVTIAVLVIIISTILFISMFDRAISWPRWTVSLYYRAAPFRSVNNYGLFSIMTTNRPEIVVEGSNDGQNWLPYEFKWKPGDLKRAPGFVEPHMPRLDWQMWFAALGSYRQNPWFINFCYRLLEGKPEVTRLLRTNPFPNAPPQYIRAVVYDYHFTDAAEHKRDGTWWKREFKGPYCPTISLRTGAPLEF